MFSSFSQGAQRVLNARLTKQIASKGLKVVGVVGAAYGAVSGFNRARADGAPVGASLMVATMDGVNPTPWSVVEMKDGLASEAKTWQRVVEQELHGGYLENRAQSVGMTLNAYKQLTGEP